MCPWCRTYGNISIKLFDVENAAVNDQTNNEGTTTNVNHNSEQSNLHLNGSNVASLVDGSLVTTSNSNQTNLFRSTTNRSNQISLMNTINNELSLSLLENNPSMGDNEETRSVYMNASQSSSIATTTTRTNMKKQRKRLNRSLNQPKFVDVRRSIQSVFNLNSGEPKSSDKMNKLAMRNHVEKFVVLKSLELPD
jgi:hypothetical protein